MWSNVPEGFLLIEVLTALAILGALVIVIMLSLARGIAWNHEAQLRLRALNAATTTIEQLAQGYSASGKKIDGCVVTVARSDALINHAQHDKIIPKTGKSEAPFSIVVVTSEWESTSGGKRFVQLLTGIVTDRQETL